jgi:hypothetical protein
MSNQFDSLKDTNSRLIDYVKSINKKVGTANNEKEFSEITENNKSRKIKEFKSKAETALWFVESYGLVPQYLKLESTSQYLYQNGSPKLQYLLFRIMCIFSAKWVCKQVLSDHNLLCSLQCKTHSDLLMIMSNHR